MYRVYARWNYRRERMKHGDMRRALLGLLLLCGGFVVYLYWQQTTRTLPRIISNIKNAYTTYSAGDPKWTWECVKQRCERRPHTDNVPAKSLSTCSMLCGSTQFWPQPTGPVTLGIRAVAFYHRQITFETTASEPARALLDRTYAHFNDSVATLVKNPDYWMQQTDIMQFLIKVHVSSSDHVRLKLATDESYNLTVHPDEEHIVASIKAKTFFGARHALETLLQLIWWDDGAEGGGMLKTLKSASVQDAPVFAYRGVMIDSARNYISVDSIKRVLVGMAANKLNVLHWHVTDSQSFPLILPQVPKLAQYGAYASDMVYRPEDVRALVDFALVRGIRVVLEVDTPAHAGNGWTWGPEEGLGDLAVCVNERPWSLYCGEPPCGQLNPDNPHVYDVLEKLYRDLIDLSGETEIFHLGGDEVNLDCWAQNLPKGSKAYNYTDLHDLWGEFTVKALNRLQNANGGKHIPHVVFWSSNLNKRPFIHKYLNRSNVVVQAWGASMWAETRDLLDDNYRVIISHVDAWYLDCGFGRWRETGDAACDPYRPWQTVYNHRPWEQQKLDKKLILGGEVCLWSEQLDQSSLDARLWPRAAAFAERVWSDPHLNMDTLSIREDVYTRLNTQRDRLVSKGLAAEALWPLWCVQNPGMCL